MSKRLCVFAHYDRDNIVDDYVYHYLSELKKISNNIVFVTVSNISNEHHLKLLDLVSEVIVRENKGYDFMSWQQGLSVVDNIGSFDEVIICNDSCYGPLRSLDKLFDEFSTKDVDFWGITDNRQIAYHLQSYFLVFKRNVVSSEVFKDFWKRIEVKPNKEAIVEEYEVGLTQLLLSNGYNHGVLIPYERVLSHLSTLSVYLDKVRRIKILTTNNPNLSNSNTTEKPYNKVKKLLKKVIAFSLKKNTNITFVGWKQLINLGSPFIKVMLLRDNPTNLIDLDLYKKVISKNSNYDVDLIEMHLKRMGCDV